MKNHIRYFHQNKQPFLCKLYPRSFSERSNLYRHIKSFHKKVKYPCNLCKLSFHSTQNVKRHVHTVHSNLKPYSCSFCSKAFTSHTNFNDHVNIYHKTRKETFNCGKCNKVFLSKFLLRCHLKRHGNNKRYKCSTCTMQFHTNLEKQRHERLQSATIEQQKCTTCNKSNSSKYGLSAHIGKYHKYVGWVSCLFCGLVCSGTSRLYDHVRSHIQEKPYRCKICDKDFFFYKI